MKRLQSDPQNTARSTPVCLGPKRSGRALCESCGSPESLSAWMNGGEA
jgi:hypothetical protein